jgi:hypothetical protein
MGSISRRDAVTRLAGLAALPLVGCNLDRATRPAGIRRTRVNTVSSVVSAPIPLIVTPDPHFKDPKLFAPAYQIAGQARDRLAANPLAWWLLPGDVVETGTSQEFATYAALALDPVLDRVLPVIGNHDHKDAANLRGESYFAYFGSRAGEPGKGWYLKTFGDTWVGFFLNSEWGRAEQAAWLAAELPNYADRHVFAVVHIPFMSALCNHSGTQMQMNWPGFNGIGQLYAQLEQHGAEFLVSGHCHSYQVYPRMRRDVNNLFTGIVDEAGVRQFVCGTGGTHTLMPFWTPASPHPHVAKAITNVRGPVEITLHQNHYEWAFTEYVSGVVQDSGTQVCRKTIVPPAEELPPEEPTCP